MASSDETTERPKRKTAAERRAEAAKAEQQTLDGQDSSSEPASGVGPVGDGEEFPTIKAAVPAEAKFSRSRLLGSDGVAITGHPPYVIAGALESVDGDEFTPTQAAEAITAWLQRPVQQEG